MQNHPEPGEDEAQIVTYRAEDGVEGVAVTALQIAAAEMAVALHVQSRFGASKVRIWLPG